MQRIAMLAATVVCAIALTVGLHAAPQAEATKGHDGKTKTMTGCLEKGDEANPFKLTHVADEAGAATKTAEAMKPDWELVGAPASLKMSDHVGHKVPVTGPHASAAAAAKMEGETGAGKAKESMERHLKVTSLKHVAPTC